MIIEVLPVIDLEPYLAVAGEIGDDTSRLSPKLIELCREVTRVLKETGALVVKDPRCTAEDNDRFIDFMEKYYERPFEFKTKQERPDLLYQGGITPEKIEVPRLVVDEEWKEKVKAMPKESQPLIPIGPDPKWRYMWNIGSRPAKTRFKQFNADAVRPESFPEWNDVMDSWGSKLRSAIE
ncbi:uncharacterized protein LOC110806612, partial [Carica papaya]|uniref:uncharacterized protein LOC110806612 n=1 Tax=Carica papaya TaxID=3649 RepID=UPI000B8D024A